MIASFKSTGMARIGVQWTWHALAKNCSSNQFVAFKLYESDPLECPRAHSGVTLAVLQSEVWQRSEGSGGRHLQGTPPFRGQGGPSGPDTPGLDWFGTTTGSHRRINLSPSSSVNLHDETQIAFYGPHRRLQT